MTKVAINGLGRIGRATLKIIQQSSHLELVAINDLIPASGLGYLLKYDTVYGRYDQELSTTKESLTLNGRTCKVFSEKDPAQLPWAELEVDLVFECSGHFTDREGMEKHLQAGARRVILSAPSKGDGVPTVVHGVNHAAPEDQLISCASCTTNCITPVMEVVGRRIGVRKAIMSTVHAYTATQAIVDTYDKKPRRGRAGAANFVPTTTGAAKATTKVLTQFSGKFDGIAVRGPTAVGSIADIVMLAERQTSVEEVNGIFREEAESTRYRGVLGVTDEPLVSSDIIGDSRASLVDLGMTKVVDGDLVKVMGWYDNEWGYASQMVKEAEYMARQLQEMKTAEPA